jgi:amino acid permease
MTGLLIGLILTIFGMLVAFWSFYTLIFSAETFGSRRYLTICKGAGGSDLGYLYQAAICVQQFGVVLSCQIISGSMVTQSCLDFGLAQSTDFISSPWLDALKIILPTIFISFPLCKQHDMTPLRYQSLIAVIAMIFAIVLIIVHLFHAISFDRPFAWYRFDLNFFSACGITFFAYQCQPTFFPVYYDLANPTVSRISKVSF